MYEIAKVIEILRVSRIPPNGPLQCSRRILPQIPRADSLLRREVHAKGQSDNHADSDQRAVGRQAGPPGMAVGGDHAHLPSEHKQVELPVFISVDLKIAAQVWTVIGIDVRSSYST